jgi:hypothetical protein
MLRLLPVRNDMPRKGYIQTLGNKLNSNYRRFIVVIDAEMERWEEAGMLLVWF